MRTIQLHLFCLVLMSVLFQACPPAPQEVDLTWTESNPVILPGVLDTLILEDLGIDDTVYVLAGTNLQSVTKNVLNLSSNGLAANTDYNVRVRIEQYAFQAVISGTTRYVPTGQFIVDTLLAGPSPIASMDSMAFTANLNQALGCGMFKLTMRIDPDQDLMDVDTTNNLYEDFLFVLSQQQFNIQLATADPTRILESGGANQVVHTFNILAASPVINNAFYTNFKVQTNLGSMAVSVPPPTTNFNPLPGLITVNVSPSAPPVDVIENMQVKITVISADGCVIKQKAAQVEILHDI